MTSSINTSMERISIPNLNANEIGFSTGNPDYPRARVRKVPLDVLSERQGTLVGAAAPMLVAVRLSASLVDENGAVETIAGRLLVGPENEHTWQFDNQAVTFDPEAWIDGCAEVMINNLLHQAKVIGLAAGAGLIAQS